MQNLSGIGCFCWQISVANKIVLDFRLKNYRNLTHILMLIYVTLCSKKKQQISPSIIKISVKFLGMNYIVTTHIVADLVIILHR